MTFPRLLIIGVVLAVFLAFMTTYTVRFNERAVVATLGKAGEGSVITEPGLRFKFPFVQSVTKYDGRIRMMQSDQETQQTLDNSQVLLTSYLTWRVDDPLKFYRRFSGAGETEREHYREAEKILKSKLRSAASSLSRYRLDELVSATATGSKIAKLEEDMFNALSSAGPAGAVSEASLTEYGIKPVAVGIAGLGLPQETTKAVFDRMKAARLKIANDTISQGKSLADTIKASAESDSKKIASFAEQLATRIRNQGDVEAAKFLDQLREDPKLAIFLENMKFMRTALGKTTTLVFPTSMPGMELFRPDAIKTLKSGQLPAPGLDALTQPQRPRTDAAPEAPAPAKQTSAAEGSR